MSKAIPVYISCASISEDKKIRDHLLTHLFFLERKNIISTRYRDKVTVGREIEKECAIQLDQAQIVLLLISHHFLASDECLIEMDRAMDRHAIEKIRVIPIILSPCEWKLTRISKLAALPKNGNSLKDCYKLKEALFHIVEQILSIVEELQGSAHAISTTEETIDINSLYESLIRLNYQQQVGLFRDFKGKAPQIGAFFIHGEASSGQVWLLNRLVNHRFGKEKTIKDFKFSFARKANGRSLTDLWLELAKWVDIENLPRAYSINPSLSDLQLEIIKRVHRQWQKHTVLLILSKPREIDESLLNRFIQEFWQPLVKMARGVVAPSLQGTVSAKHYLLMFILDDIDCVDRWHIAFSEQLDQAWEPELPVKFEKLGRFTHEVLSDWLLREQEADIMPETLTVREILQYSENGIPDFVLEYICGIFGYELEQMIKYRI